MRRELPGVRQKERRMKEWKIDHDPSIAALVKVAPLQWGSPDKNSAGLIPYGIGLIDRVTYGIDFNVGGLMIVQGAEKERKTTFLANVIANICMSGKYPDGWRIAVDLAESGLPPRKYRDILIGMVATKILIYRHWFGTIHELRDLLSMNLATLDMSTADIVFPVREMIVDHKFLRYRSRTAEQKEAIEQSMGIVASWPLDIFGPAKSEGYTRKLDLARARWNYCIERGARMLVYDHVQQFEVVGKGDYDTLLEVTPIIAGAVVETPGLVFFAISQTSMGSRKDAMLGIGKRYARGGTKLAEEANNVFDITYDGANEYQVIVRLLESRDSRPIDVKQGIESASGLFVGEATPHYS